MGASDVLEVFSIYGQNSFSSSNAGNNTRTTELSRVLLEFPVSGSGAAQIYGDSQNDLIPASGSVNFFLKLLNLLRFSFPTKIISKFLNSCIKKLFRFSSR